MVIDQLILFKRKLSISFSGGRTSAYMLWYLLKEWKDRDQWEINVVYANTGLEHEGTLKFINECSRRWDIKIIWVEAIPVESERGKWWGVAHKIVTYETASRAKKLPDGYWTMTPFELVISKLGIPSSSAPFCSDQLKRKAILSYRKSMGWQDCYTAIGIRVDEIDRVNEQHKKKRLFYPLVSPNPTTKRTILDWWMNQEFDLEIHEDEGNCVNCWKKNTNLLCRNAVRVPQSYEWWQYITDKYGQLNPRNVRLKPPFNFYRGNLSPKDIFKLAELPASEIEILSKEEKLHGCIESCEVF